MHTVKVIAAGFALLGLLLVGQIPQVNEIVGIGITLLGIAMVLI